jgi:hypothetical protein
MAATVVDLESTKATRRRKTARLAGFCAVLLSAAAWSPAAQAFSYQPWIDGEPRTLSIGPMQVDTQAGEVVVNGADSRAPTVAFTCHWGDGTVDNEFFPLAHTYQDLTQDYVLEITAHYDDGSEDTLRAGVYFVEPEISPVVLPDDAAVSIPESHVELATRMPYSLNPNLTFLPDACFGVISRQSLEYLLSVGATVQLGFVDWDVYLPDGSFHQVLLQDPDLTGGMVSLWFTTPVSFAAPCAAVATTADLPSMLHEMGHNITLNFPAGYHYGGKIDGNANAIYSETMAQIFAHAALYEIVNAGDTYGLPAELVTDLEQQAIGSFGIVKQWYQRYLDEGTNYSSWNDPATGEDETLATFMTIAYKFIEHAEDQSQGFAAPVTRLSAFLGRFSEDWHARYSPDANSPEAEAFRATLLVAALSDAFSTDLREEFRALGFPVDDAVFDELLCEDCGAGGAGGSAGAAGGFSVADAGAAGGSAVAVAGAAGSPPGLTTGGEGGEGGDFTARGGAGGSAQQPITGGTGGATSPQGGAAGTGGSNLAAGHAGTAGAATGGVEASGGRADAAGLSAAGAGGWQRTSTAAGDFAAATAPGAAAQSEGCHCSVPASGSSLPAGASIAWLLAAAALALGARTPPARPVAPNHPAARTLHPQALQGEDDGAGQQHRPALPV